MDPNADTYTLNERIVKGGGKRNGKERGRWERRGGRTEGREEYSIG